MKGTMCKYVELNISKKYWLSESYNIIIYKKIIESENI